MHRWCVPASASLFVLPLTSKYTSNTQNLSQLLSSPSLPPCSPLFPGSGGMVVPLPLFCPMTAYSSVSLQPAKLQCRKETEGI